MPELRFEAPTHPELVLVVRAWLESAVAGTEPGVADVVGRSADLTKDALRLVASAAPAPLAESDLLKGLTELGYKVTDTTRDTVLAGLDAVATVSEGGLVRKATRAGASALYEMNVKVARQVLRGLAPR